MKTNDFTITVHIVSSLNGIIAKKDNSVSWFETGSHYEKGISVSAEETVAALSTIDCYVMGSRTYEHAEALSKNYGWAYGEKPVIVLSHRDLAVGRPNVSVFSGDLTTLIDEKLIPRYKQVWVVGGAELCRNFIQSRLADELRMIVIPVILEGGLPFLDQPGIDQPLQLKNVSAYRNGSVELIYRIRK